MVINDLYRMEDKQVETLFSFDEEVLKKALKNLSLIHISEPTRH